MRANTHQHAAATAATAALSVCLGSDAQYLDDCNANGVSDAVEIAQGLVSDCDGNGIPDTCDYAGESRGLRTLSAGWYETLAFYLTVPEPVSSDIRLDIGGVGDFGDADEYLNIYLGEVLVATVWQQDGLDCDPNESTYQEATVYIPQDVFNLASEVGTVALRIVPSEAVYSTPDCNGGWARVQYLRALSDDCNGNGIPDSCDIANDAALDCNGNGTIDACEVSANIGYFDYDCDDDGVHDACQIAADPALDSNSDWVLDAYQISLGDFTLDRIIDGADLAYVLESWGPSKGGAADLNQDGLVDAFELARVLGNWGRYPTGWGVVLEAAPNPRVVTHDGFRAGIEATGLPWRIRDNKTGIELLLVPPGQFMMGCSPSNQGGCPGNENPVHEVTLTSPFYLSRYEVTQAQWSTSMGANPSYHQNPSSEVPASQIPLRPVERVSWNMIQGFEVATDLRLPTEAEWEYACRAGTDTAFNRAPHGTNDDGMLAQLAWFGQAPATWQTRVVGQKLANNLGLHDMHGNVWEWVEDRYGSNYYAQSPAVDPPGPASGWTRVMRGGSWEFPSNVCRASFRTDYFPGDGNVNLGFRAARTP